MHPYLEFLRYCLDGQTALPDSAAAIDWQRLLVFAKQQTLVGIYWAGMQRMTATTAHRIPQQAVVKWMAEAKRIEAWNARTDKKAKWVWENFRKEGFRSFLLKGQGNALFYPVPSQRTPGDIDMFVEGGDRKVLTYIDRLRPERPRTYHHVHFMQSEGINIEAHYRPSWLNNPFHNRRLQRWFEQEGHNCLDNRSPALGINVPTLLFNHVFQVCHIYHHLVYEGVGLRQIVDYYYLLRGSQLKSDEVEPLLRRLGLMPMAQALAYIMSDVLGMQPTCLVTQPDIRKGEALLQEIIEGGNFGKYDPRPLSGHYTSSLRKNSQRLWRDLRLIRHFPSECLWEPPFRIWHWWWRRHH